MEHQIKSLLNFLDSSPCNFYAVHTVREILINNGFAEKSLEDALTAQPGEKFFVTKNHSAIFAFTVGKKPVADTGLKIIAAHSDSPCFRVKPHAEMLCEGGIVKLNTEVYGGPILYTWFDRPLSLAGRVLLKGNDALHPITRLVKIDRPLFSISHLAIHFNRAVNEGNKISKQKDMLPIIAKVNNTLEAENMLLHLVADELQVETGDIIDFDLLVYNTEKATTFGLNNEFISAGRLDDLSMVHAAIEAIIDVKDDNATCVAAIFDNEETGSGTKQGAGSPVLANVIQRMVESQGGNYDGYCRALAKSFLVSADNAHAFHPNYAEKYDPTNHPALGGGPCIKINANCKYMSDAHSAAIFKSLCIEAGAPYQYFVNHSDVAGGSTLGNILTGQMDIAGVDVGNPLLAMHSVRETGSVTDHINMIKVFKQFFS
ncbi:MAG: M18 family aminopeptidase [bacterium]|nr:M18 family aminopeptidase [bacterium]MDY4185791.1 M18 family aminopeptidase [Sodaliphilus sp.]